MARSRTTISRRVRTSVLPVLLVLAFLWVPMPTAADAGRAASAEAQAVPPARLTVTAGPDEVRIDWQGAVAQDAAGAPVIAGEAPAGGLQPVEIGGLRVPARLVAVRVPDGAAVTPRIQAITAAPWLGALPKATRTATETILADTPAATGLPIAPITMLRDGRIRGVRVVVLAFSPLFLRDGQAQAASSVQATIPGVSLFSTDGNVLSAQTGPFLAPAAVTPPTNSIAALDAITVRVAHEGIQRITGAALAAAGLDLAQLDPAGVHLWRNGVEIPLDAQEVVNGRLAAATALRFYASAPGDRWNSTDTYWLIVSGSNALRMAQRSVPVGTGVLATTAVEARSWRHNALYDSLLPGPHGDHWYAVDLASGPGGPPANWTVQLTNTLPLITGPVVITITGSSRVDGPHHLMATLGGVSQALDWKGDGDWSESLTFSSSAADLSLTMPSPAADDSVLVDGVAWTRPVTLDAGGKGAVFAGMRGVYHYHLVNVPAQAAVYDVSNPLAPAVLSIPSGTTLDFGDGPQPHTYLLAGVGTVYEPVLAHHAAVDLAAQLNADTLYIAPAAFQAELAPLLAWRTSQGRGARAIDVQSIYDAWSYGQVSPDAIRAFLRYASATWMWSPQSVVLVGDGTSDPLDFTAHHNADFIPPYLAMVDPWAGETACETCYAQLDGDNPLDDLLPDVALGRLPVKSAAELHTFVQKLLTYEKIPHVGAWGGRETFITDNYREADNTADPAGDFWTFADAAIAQQPGFVTVQRMYYDPSPSNLGDPWHVGDALVAYQNTLDLLNRGASLVVYAGHSHQWQWAITDPATVPSYLLGLYDTDALTNAGRPAVLLEMTCLTSAFQTPAFSGTTIDERFLLHPTGGAVAVWGSTGLGILNGHDKLLDGFYGRLWQDGTGRAALGDLTAAGYLNVFTNGACCQSSARVFALLGDPLTEVSVAVYPHVYLPVTIK
jgi:hypothetical protein